MTTKQQSAPRQQDTKPSEELVWWPPDPRDPAHKPRRITVQFRGNTTGRRYYLSFGDGTQMTATGTNIYPHEYDNTGLRQLTARDTTTGRPIRTRTVAVVRPGMEPQVTIEPEGGDDWTRHLLTFPSDDTVLPTRWRVHWPGDTDPTEYWARPGETVDTILDAGTWDIPVKDVHGQQSTTVQVIVASPYDPNWQSVWRGDEDPSGMTLGFKLLSVQDKTVLVDPGDGTDPIEVANPTNDQVVDHTFTKTGNFLAEVKYKDGSGTPLKDLVKVPWA